MSASATLAYALIAESDRDPLVVGLIVALVGAVVAVITTMMSNASANRRQRLELRSRNGHSSTVGLLWVAIAILSVGILYVATRSDDTTEVASAGPVPSSTVAPQTTPTTIADSAFPACEAFTVQIGAIEADKKAAFVAQAQFLIQAMPQLGELHSAAGDPCGTSLTQFYFGPFANADEARAACFGVGHVLQDNPTEFTAFNNPDTGQINYPYYRIAPKTPELDGNGDALLCNPANEQG